MDTEVDKIQQAIEVILKEYGYKIGYKLEFPLYREFPDEVQLALKVLAKHGLKVLLTIEPKEKEGE